MRAFPTNDDAIQSPGMPVLRSLHDPDTINVLRSTSRTPRGKRGILREKDKGGRREGAEREINLSDLVGEHKVSRALYEYGHYMNTKESTHARYIGEEVIRVAGDNYLHVDNNTGDDNNTNNAPDD